MQVSIRIERIISYKLNLLFYYNLYTGDEIILDLANFNRFIMPNKIIAINYVKNRFLYIQLIDLTQKKYMLCNGIIPISEWKWKSICYDLIEL